MYRDLKIVFDVKNQRTIFMNPSSRPSASGVCASNGVIYISAVKNNDYVQGLIAHELMHFVIFEIFNNDSKPYYDFDFVRKQEFDAITEKYRKMSESKDSSSIQVFNDIFRSYSREKFASEIIASVPQKLASFSAEDSFRQ